VSEARIEIGSPEWVQLTQRRAELIYKKNRYGLTPEELSEYESLQKRSQEVIDREFPLGLYSCPPREEKGE